MFGNPGVSYFAGFTNSTVGSVITVGNQPVTITALGVYDRDQDGLARNHEVGIWDTGFLIASATVPAGTGATLVGDYRYVTLSSPLILPANMTFTIGAFFDIVGFVSFDSAGVGGTSTLNPAFSSAVSTYFDGYEVNTSLAEPTLNYGDTLWGPNLMLQEVPEPSTAALLGGGLLLLLRFKRKA